MGDRRRFRVALALHALRVAIGLGEDDLALPVGVGANALAFGGAGGALLVGDPLPLGLHAAERLNGATFRWTEPVVVLDLRVPATATTLTLRVLRLRSLDDGQVVAAWGSRPLPSSEVQVRPSSVTVSVPPGRPGPLTISQSTSGPPTVGLPVTFTITVTNTTSGQATDVFLGDTLPIGARLTGALPNPNRCAKGGASGSQAFACLVGTLGASGSGSESFSINFTIIPSASTLDNKAATTGFAGGSFVTNSVDLILGAAPAPTDVQITGSSSTGSPSAGSPFAYVFQVKNSGPQLASAVSFSDTLPAGERVLGAHRSLHRARDLA